MARYCARCNRDVHDEDFHEVRRLTVISEVTGRPMGVTKTRDCKVRLIADDAAVDLGSGQRVVRRRYIPDTPQRTSTNNARFAIESAFEPGGRYE